MTAPGDWRWLSMAVADTAITVWDSKKHYMLWRPITAIHEAEKDGNPATAADPAWQPFLITPPYPDYTSGGNGVTGATTAHPQLYFGKDDVPFTVTSTSKEAKRRRATTRASRTMPTTWSMCASTKACTSASLT